MGKFDTHGGYFTPQDYFRINEGGSHSENPNGGVQVGKDSNGIPNLLEEGEPVYRDYVYSDNIRAQRKILERFNLPQKYEGELYSKIADKYIEEAELRPNDFISRNGLRAMLSRLAEAQEYQKQQKEKRKINKVVNEMTPEQLNMLSEIIAPENQQQPVEIIPRIDSSDTIDGGYYPQQGVTSIQQSSMPEIMATGGLLRRFEDGTPGELVVSDRTPFAVRDNTMTPFVPNTGLVPAELSEGQKAQMQDARMDSGLTGFIPYLGDAVTIAQTAKDVKNGDYMSLALAPLAILTNSKIASAAKGFLTNTGAKIASGAKNAVGSVHLPTSGRAMVRKTVRDAKKEAESKVVDESLKAAKKAASDFEVSMKALESRAKELAEKQATSKLTKKEAKELAGIPKKYDAANKGLRTTNRAIFEAENPTKSKILKGLGVSAGAGLAGWGIGSMIKSGNNNKMEVGKEDSGLSLYDFAKGGMLANTYNDGSKIDFSNPSGYAYGVPQAVYIPSDVQVPLRPDEDIIGPILSAPAKATSANSHLLPYNNTNTFQYYKDGRYDSGYLDWLNASKFQENQSLYNELSKYYNTKTGRTLTPEQAIVLGKDGKFRKFHDILGRGYSQYIQSNTPTNAQLVTPASTKPTVNETLLQTILSNKDISNAVQGVLSSVSPAPEAVTTVDGKSVDPTQSSSTGTVSVTPRYSTLPRYAGIVNNAVAALHNIGEKPDVYQYSPVRPVYPEGTMPLRMQEYMPMDISIPVNMVRQNTASTARGIVNSGAGPSTGAILLANAFNGSNAQGTAFNQGWLSNWQQRNAVTGANNQALAQQAQFDANMNSSRANIYNRFAPTNSAMTLRTQMLNNQSEQQKATAISNSIENLVAGLAGIGTENFRMNQINGNPALYPVLNPDGTITYVRPASRGGLLKTYTK